MLRRLRIENLVLIREAELQFAPGLNAITGETGAGKTIFAQSVGLLLGGRADAAMVGPAGDETYVEAELDAEPGETLAELKPADEDSLVVARRIFGDGRTRAYAWGRAAAREDVAAAAEGAIAMSGQFQQRRLARPAFQLDVLDAFAGAGELRGELRTAWRELSAARRRHEELLEGAARAAERVEELRALVEATEGLEPGTRGGSACAARAAASPRRSRHRHRRRGRGARARGRRRRRGSRGARRASGGAARVARARARARRRRAA